MRNSSYKIIFIILLLLFSSGPFISFGLDDRYTRGLPSARNGSDIVFNATEDEPFEATIGNDIVSGDNVTFSFLEKPYWLEMENGSIIGTPGNDDVGWTNFTMNITSTTDQLFLNISINVMNNPPTIIEGSLSLMAWEDRYYESELLLEEEGEKWEVRMRQSGPWNTTWLEVDRTGKVFGTPRNVHVGNWTVNLTLDDMNGGLAFLEWNVNVLNEPPNITVKDYGIVQEWEEKTIDFDCRSEGDGATYYHFIRDDFGGSLDPVTGEFTFLPGLSGMTGGIISVRSVDFFNGSDTVIIEVPINNTPPKLTSELPSVFIAGEEVLIDLQSNDEPGYVWYNFVDRRIIFSDATTNQQFHATGRLRVLPWNLDAGSYSFMISLMDKLEVRYYFWNFTVIENSTFKDPQIELEPLSVSENMVRIGVNINAYGQTFYIDELYHYVNIRYPGSGEDLAGSYFDPVNQTFVEVPISNVTGLVNVSLHLFFENMDGSYRGIIKTIQVEIPTPNQNRVRNDHTFPWWSVFLLIVLSLLAIMGVTLLLIEKTSYAIKVAVLRRGTIDEEPILALVHDKPGIRFRDLLEHSNFSRRDLVSTLIGLEKAGNVRPIHDGFLVRFYPTVGSFVDGPLVLTRHQQRIAGVLMDTRKASIDELSKITGSSRKRLERETSLMELKGIINRKKGRNGPEYFMSSRQKRSFDEWRGRNTI